jgi:hypothetical protein
MKAAPRGERGRAPLFVVWDGIGHFDTKQSMDNNEQ